MAAISRIKVGQTLFTVKRQRMGNTTMTQQVVHPVRVTAIDPNGQFVEASWNYNAPQKFYAGEVAKWKVSKPGTKAKKVAP